MVFSSARKNNFRQLEIFFRYNNNVKEFFIKSVREEKCVADGNQKTNYLKATAKSSPQLCITSLRLRLRSVVEVKQWVVVTLHRDAVAILPTSV